MMSPIVTREQAIARYFWASAVFAWNRPVPMPRGAVMDQYDEAVAFWQIHEDQCKPEIRGLLRGLPSKSDGRPMT